MSKKSGSGNIGQTIYASGLRNGVFTGVGVRPTNLGYPTGLSGEPPVLAPMDYLIVAGGGGGGSHNDARYPAGGGGGGGYRIGSGYYLTQAQTWSVVVGAGGLAYPAQPSLGGTNGANSGIYIPGTSAIWSTGGGGGGGPSQPGFSGGSGGGGGNNGAPGGAGNAGGYTPSEGNNGGGAVDQYTSGGGGGAGGAGGTPFTGGLGSNNTITGSSVYYSYGGWGGQGPGTAGNTNTGGGGTGCSSSPYYEGYVGKNGGSGIVVLRYAAPQIATGGTITNLTGNVIHTFTGDGFFNVVSAGWSIN